MSWIVNRDKYDGRPRWYTCPVCCYTYDDTIDHVSDTGYCPNCQNVIEARKEREPKMRHLIVLSEEEIKSLLEGKKIEIISYGPPIVIMSEDTFITEESQ